MRRTTGWLISHPWAIIGAAGALLFGIWVVSTRSQAHEVRAVFDDAVSIAPGLDVRIHGLDVGKITSVDYQDGQAIVGLGINDKQFWPLHRGTTATMRFGTTVGNGTRIIDVAPGPKSAPEIPDHGIIANNDTVETTEFDQLFNTFDANTRQHMQRMLAGTGRTFGPRAPELNRGLKYTAPGLEAVGGVMADLGADEMALKSLVANTHRVTRTLGAKSPQIADIVGVAAATFDEFARNSRAMQRSLEEFPATLRETRTTLARLDGSVRRLDPLFADLRPGAAQLRPLARDLRPALADLRRTVPAAVSTVRAGRSAAPPITALLAEATPFSRDFAPAFRDLAPALACIRPYAPELAGFIATWAGYTKNYDATSHYARVLALEGPTSSTSSPPLRTDQFTSSTGQLYALPRPPGLNAGQPWFLPECGAGPNSLDPSQDPEDKDR